MLFFMLLNLEEKAQRAELTLINHNLKGWQENFQIFLKIKCYIFAYFIIICNCGIKN